MPVFDLTFAVRVSDADGTMTDRNMFPVLDTFLFGPTSKEINLTRKIFHDFECY